MDSEVQMVPRRSWLTYLLATAVALVSFLTATFLPVPETYRGVASTPGVLALLGVVYQIWRDQRAHERAFERQRQQQDFTLGIASHMATVTFDKHVAFCETYIRAMYEGLAELFRTGPSPQALTVAGHLTQIRAEYTPWLSPEIEAKVEPFERALGRIGGGAGLMEHEPIGSRRSRLVQEIFDSLGIVHGLVEAETEEQQQIVASRGFERLRELLGIRELTRLRQEALHSAMSRLRN